MQLKRDDGAHGRQWEARAAHDSKRNHLPVKRKMSAVGAVDESWHPVRMTTYSYRCNRLENVALPLCIFTKLHSQPQAERDIFFASIRAGRPINAGPPVVHRSESRV